VAGYNFCGRLKITGDAGFVDAHHLYADGKASFIIGQATLDKLDRIKAMVVDAFQNLLEPLAAPARSSQG
jgi:hypothetical protein